MVHYNVCPLCSSGNIGLQFVCKDHFVSKKEFPVYKCSSCDFTFTQDYPEENEIGKFYESENYISHSDISEGLSNKLYKIGRNFMLWKKKNLIINITGVKTGNLLDVGSGTGYFVSAMNRAGWKSKGIEINETARKFSISHFGLEILSPDEISTLKSNSYDCITLWHVLEHFHDPLKYISEISHLLKPGATCVIAMPNCSSFDALHYTKFWAAWDVPRHLWHFNPSTFSLFTKKSGLTLEKIRVLPLDVIYISTLSEKYKESALPFITGMLKAFIFAFLSTFNKRRSSSVVYILRKPTG
jgi:2-polyprenyl-3-methyl-5-hydroxy-6-metoxy-1,4-benzoquinol methylase